MERIRGQMMTALRGCTGQIVYTLGILCLLLVIFCSARAHAQGEEDPAFEISEYVVKGSTLIPYDVIADRLRFHTGRDKTAKEVEAARTALETFYHSEGYPTVFVNIPQQEIREGIVVLEVIESRLGEVRVTGNRYYTRDKILSKLPSFRTGGILFSTMGQKEVNRANMGADLKVNPILMPGSEPGTTDVELKVSDTFPLHGSLEVNNKVPHHASPLRLNGVLHYDNLWQEEHSLTLQYQTSPRDTDDIKAYTATYVLPAPWNEDHILAAYFYRSDSRSSLGEGFRSAGKGTYFGAQYVVPLPFYKLYSHSISFGLDYKSMKENLTQDVEAVETPVRYMPLNFQYRSGLTGGQGETRFEAGMSMVFRSLVTEADEFEDKRYKARPSYLITKLGIERDQSLPAGTGLFVRGDVQMSDQPLISDEQYPAGGIVSVRGYRESEESGDNALHMVLELRGPDMTRPFRTGDRQDTASHIFTRKQEDVRLDPYIFFDAARLTIYEPLKYDDPGYQDQRRSMHLAGTGLGIRGKLTRFLEFEVDYAVALRSTDQTEKNDRMVHFSLKGEF